MARERLPQPRSHPTPRLENGAPRSHPQCPFQLWDVVGVLLNHHITVARHARQHLLPLWVYLHERAEPSFHGKIKRVALGGTLSRGSAESASTRSQSPKSCTTSSSVRQMRIPGFHHSGATFSTQAEQSHNEPLRPVPSAIAGRTMANRWRWPRDSELTGLGCLPRCELLVVCFLLLSLASHALRTDNERVQ